MAGGIGATIDAGARETPHAFFFGEDQGRYVVTVADAASTHLIADARRADVPVERIGVTGGAALTLPGEAPIAIAALRQAHESVVSRLHGRIAELKRMLNLVPVKALAGFNYVRVDQVVAISATDPTKCTIYMAGGVSIPAPNRPRT